MKEGYYLGEIIKKVQNKKFFNINISDLEIKEEDIKENNFNFVIKSDWDNLLWIEYVQWINNRENKHFSATKDWYKNDIYLGYDKGYCTWYYSYMSFPSRPKVLKLEDWKIIYL